MNAAAVSRCRSCRAEIVWATTQRNRKAIPLDVAPVQPGTHGALVLVDGWAYGPKELSLRFQEKFAISEELADQRVAQDYPWHASHHSTCPNAATHRRSSR